MPPLSKLLSKFNKEDRQILEFLIEQIISPDWRNLDIKRLKGYEGIFRLKRGKIRIIFAQNKQTISIISIERRSDKIYNF